MLKVVPFQILSTFFCLVLLFCVTLEAARAESLSANSPYTETGDFSSSTQTKIETLFNNLETIGNAYNGGGNKAASLAVIDASCQAALDQFFNSRLVSNLSPVYKGNENLPAELNDWISGKINTLSVGAKASLCQMLKGEDAPSIDLVQTAQSTLRNDFFPMLMASGVDFAHQSGLPFLTRLEVELGTSDSDLISSITSIQPLWEDPTNTHHIFSQLSYYRAPRETDDNGFRTKHDTINMGLAYRYLTPDQKKLYGANIFFDHAPKRNHNRMSLGVDARTSQLAVSANRYIPLSSWKTLDLYYEDRATAGWDMELRGQIPELPSWTASLKGYEWDEQDDSNDLYGVTATVEYSPVPALSFKLGVDDDSQSSPDLQAAISFNYRFDQPQDLQWVPRTELAPVTDYVYEKVHRENIIRSKVRRKASSKLSVIETSGANTAIEASGSSSLSVGKTLLMPVTVTTANTVGAYARLRFAKGATLTLGQNTQATIVPDLITLVSGTIQYVSDGVIETVVVPGGTIELHGTDIDIVSNGTDSSVRVRDGGVTFTGTVSGSATIGAEDMARSVTGVVGTVASGTAPYTTHTDQVSTQVDRVADELSGTRVTPYPYEAPYIISENLTPGQQIVIGLPFSDSVVVSGGTPFLNVNINGNSGTAPLVSGSGTSLLQFAYTVQAADGGASSITVLDMDKNGASVMGNGKDAVTTIADATLTLSGSVSDIVPPAGYAVAFTTDPVNIANVSAGAFSITSAEVGATFNYTISSSGGGTPVTGSGTIAGATQNVTGLDLSGLNDGTLTVSVTLTDASLNAGTPVTDTVTKDVVAPTILSITPPASATYSP